MKFEHWKLSDIQPCCTDQLNVMTTALEVNKIKWIEGGDIYHVNLTGQNDSEQEFKGSFLLYLHSITIAIAKKYYICGLKDRY